MKSIQNKSWYCIIICRESIRYHITLIVYEQVVPHVHKFESHTAIFLFSVEHAAANTEQVKAKTCDH